ncbi:hypothetical protein VNO77_15063 [Canavalia gladiata]|uniref:Uncharacterized protein n=1 Tax=Canavalia gladiata TaxID=3824 RepID=A0AAN9QS75_CANGL
MSESKLPARHLQKPEPSLPFLHLRDKQSLCSGPTHRNHPDSKTPQLRELHVDAHTRARPESLLPGTDPVIGIHGTPREKNVKPVASHHVNRLLKNKSAMNNCHSRKPLRRKEGTSIQRRSSAIPVSIRDGDNA